ncbi:MAG: ATP-binding protein [Lysobacterales bacterium]|jgi:C4-dicarboxylate-specific signal transduction histidine kinase
MQRHFRWTVLALEVFICLMVLGTLAVLLLSVYRNTERFRPVERHIAFVTALRKVEESGAALFDDSALAGAAVSSRELENLRNRLGTLRRMDAHLDAATPGRLQKLVRSLSAPDVPTQGRAERFLDGMDSVIDAEIDARQGVLQSIASAMRNEKSLTTILAVALPLVLLGSLVVFRFYVVAPARRIAGLLTDLGESRFEAVETDGAPQAMRPILENYNGLVMRLAQLESEQHRKQATLERQVHIASGNLVRLQRTLANAEKLAVAGEIAAGIAHELRNPLAGIRAALDNLRAEMQEPDQLNRLNLVIAELKRMTALLNHLLEQTGVAPELPVSVDVGNAIDEVARLVAFQLPESVRIEQDVEQDLSLTLPEDRFRQVMLNLVLNSAQVIGNQPGTISIQAQRAGSQVEIVVSDDGPGFPEAMLESGPQPFFSQRDRGSGLGLATVRRFARDAGGRMTIANIQPHGARVTLYLPQESTHDG